MWGRGFWGLLAAVCLTPGLAMAQAGNAPASADQKIHVKAPSPDVVGAAFPRLALKRGVDGRARVRCTVETTGFLTHCHVVDEHPTGLGFGAAALSLAPASQA